MTRCYAYTFDGARHTIGLVRRRVTYVCHDGVNGHLHEQTFRTETEAHATFDAMAAYLAERAAPATRQLRS